MMQKQHMVVLTVLLAGSLLLGSVQYPMPAYGHGLAGDMSKSAAIGDRLAAVKVQMKPSFLLAEAPQDATIEFKFFDTKTNNPIKHVTYFIKLIKNDKTVMMEWFHAHDGDLFIKVRPSKQEKVVFNADVDPITAAYIGSKDSPVLATGPIFLEGGLYHFVIEIFGIDFDNTPLPQALKYDTYVSIGETATFAVTNGAEHKISVRTYYDKIGNFIYGDKTNTVQFSMPINWNKEYLATVPLVHEEVLIPKSFKILVDDRYTGTVNGIRLPEGAIMVDDTNPDEQIIHIMLSNKQLVQLAEHLQAMGTSNVAEFVLAPGIVNIGMELPLTGGMGGEAMALSSKKLYHSMLTVIPGVIEPAKPVSFACNFMDTKAGNMVDVKYDFAILSNGKELIRKSGSTIGGTASEQFTFANVPAGKITVRFEKLNGTEEYVEFTLSGSSAPAKSDVSFTVKQTSKSAKITIKNKADAPIYSVKLKTGDGTVKSVKVKGWDSKKIDPKTVLVSAKDKPLLKGKSLTVMLAGSKLNSPIEWSVLDKSGNVLSTGFIEPAKK